MIKNRNITDYYNQKSYLRNATLKNFYLDTTLLPRVASSRGIYVIVPPECENRIDLFSYQQYQTSRLWWIIALANADAVKDPIWDFKAGMSVFVPRDTSLIEQLAGAK